MKSIETKIGRVIIGKVMPDEDLLNAIVQIVKKYEIKAGLINIIGALKKFTLGYFNLNTKEYQFKTFDKNVELVSCMGNISWKEGEPIIHLHISVGCEDYSIIGGHLSQPSIVSVTAEIYIYEIDQKLNRTTDPTFNLSLLDI
ncbi:MAG: PPC domain-containing DNA-binding protein [Promethearchaeota archaeon]